MGRVQPFPCETEQDQKIGWIRSGVPWLGSKLVSPTSWRAGLRIGLRSFVFCWGAAVTIGTRPLCWEECAGELSYRSGGQWHMCSFSWFSWFPPPEGSASGGWDRQYKVWTDFRVSSALLLVISADRFWATSWSLLCKDCLMALGGEWRL